MRNFIVLVWSVLLSVAKHTVSLEVTPPPSPVAMSPTVAASSKVLTIPARVWRSAASTHANSIRSLLKDGLYSKEDCPSHRSMRRQQRDESSWTSLNPRHATFNFLMEYYGLKGVKGVKQLARWSPSIGLWLHDSNKSSSRIESLEDLEEASKLYADADNSSRGSQKILRREHISTVLLEDATPDDFGETLHLRGAQIIGEGVLYSHPNDFYQPSGRNSLQWYHDVLEATLKNPPNLQCHGLHEWSMQYWPAGADQPPSAKYQSHLPLRVSQETINAAVERKGTTCTHVDALRFFAPAAGPLNLQGASLERVQQLQLEQSACVHAHMDLLKHVLKLRPYSDSFLLKDVLELALAARTLDVAASPYDVSEFGIAPIPIETPEGRKEYRRQQRILMERAKPVRENLLQYYKTLLELGFEDNTKELPPDPERFASAQPGGKPWRQNLLEQPAVQSS